MTIHDEAIGRDPRFLPIPHLHSTPSLGGLRRNIAITFGVKNRIVWLLDGEKILKKCLLILTEYTNMTDGQRDRRKPHDGIGRSYALHRAAKTDHRFIAFSATDLYFTQPLSSVFTPPSGQTGLFVQPVRSFVRSTVTALVNMIF